MESRKDILRREIRYAWAEIRESTTVERRALWFQVLVTLHGFGVVPESEWLALSGSIS